MATKSKKETKGNRFKMEFCLASFVEKRNYPKETLGFLNSNELMKLGGTSQFPF